MVTSFFCQNNFCFFLLPFSGDEERERRKNWFRRSHELVFTLNNISDRIIRRGRKRKSDMFLDDKNETKKIKI